MRWVTNSCRLFHIGGWWKSAVGHHTDRVSCEKFVQNYPLSCSSLTFIDIFYFTDLDECASGPCQNGGQCINQDNMYTCICTTGWEGENCEIGMYKNSVFHWVPFVALRANVLCQHEVNILYPPG